MTERWERVPLGEVMHLDVDPVDVEAGQTYPLAGVFSFGRGLFWREPLAAEKTKYRTLHRLRLGQVVMSKLKAWEGALAVVDGSFDGAVLSPEFPTFTLSDCVLPEFMRLVVSAPNFAKRLVVESRGVGARRERVHPTRLLEVEVLLPGIDDQRRIVDVVASVDSTHSAAQLLRTRLQGALDAVERDAVGRLQTFETVPLGDLAAVVGGATKDTKKEHSADLVEVPYLRVANVQRGHLRLDEIKTIRITKAKADALELRVGDVLLNEGGDRDKLGRGWVWEGQIARCVHQNHVFRARVEDPDAFDPTFVSIWANSFGQRWFYENGGQTSGIASISLSTLKRFPVPVVDIDTQRDLVRLGDSFRDAVLAISDEIAALGRLSESIRADLLSGHHRIPEAYDTLLREAS